MQNELPKIVQRGSFKVEVKSGETYRWCACGLSDKQPFCNGSHAGTGLAPIVYTADSDKMVGFCGCKHSKNGALCDGSHKNL